MELSELENRIKVLERDMKKINDLIYKHYSAEFGRIRSNMDDIYADISEILRLLWKKYPEDFTADGKMIKQ